MNLRICKSSSTSKISGLLANAAFQLSLTVPSCSTVVLQDGIAEGNLKPNNCTSVFTVLSVDGTPMCLYDCAANGEPQSRTSDFAATASEEFVEYAMLVAGCKPGTGIQHFHFNGAIVT